jgi:anti-sigma factor RsiW
MAPIDDIRWLLPAYVAGSLDEREHARVESEIQRSPALLAETLELQLVNEHLLEVRAELDA